jgi:hypothetical protein
MKESRCLPEDSVRSCSQPKYVSSAPSYEPSKDFSSLIYLTFCSNFIQLTYIHVNMLLLALTTHEHARNAGTDADDEKAGNDPREHT